MDQFTPEQWDAIVQSMGEGQARATFKKYGWAIPGEASVDPNIDAAPAMDAVGAAPAEGGPPEPPAMPQGLGVPRPGTSSLAVEGGEDDDLQNELLHHYDKVDRMRTLQFEQARQAIEKQRMGPSLSERLYALSAAFAAPQRYKGFTGMMANVMPVMAKYSGEARTAKDDRVTKLQDLASKYLEGNIEGEGDKIKTRLDIAKLRDLQRKANEPTYQLDPITGHPRAVPKRVFRPQTEAEFLSIPEGEFFQTKGMTEPVQKVSGGAGG